ncbi:MAG TPA: YncE family protein, partial [Methylocella sp.]|nr:YncE family protein [Methylocella sp.]
FAVIAKASNTVVARVPVGFYFTGVRGIAITPDGKHAYVPNITTKPPMGPHAILEVSVFDTASNTVVALVPGPGEDQVVFPGGVAVTPDGTRAYVTDFGSSFSSLGTVAVIATNSNTLAATITAGNSNASEVAITPDGKSAYVTGGDNIAVIDTASNTVVDTIPVGAGAVGIIPDIPFAAFSAKLEIDLGISKGLTEDGFRLRSDFTLGSTSKGINPPAQPVTLQVGTFAATIQPGSFKGTGFGPFTFQGLIDGVTLEVVIYPTGTKRYVLVAAAQNAHLTGTANPVTVRNSIGVDSGTTSVTATSTSGPLAAAH